MVGKLRKLLLVFLKVRLPSRVRLRASLAHAILELIVHAVRNEKSCILGPSVILLHQLDFCFAQRFAVRFVRILFVRRTISDVAINDDQCRPVFCFQEILVRACEHFEVVCIGNVRDVPSVTCKACGYIFAK